MRTFRCRSRDELRRLRDSECFRGRKALEEHLAARTSAETAFPLPGICTIDDAPVDFHVRRGPDGSINWRETLICPRCGLNNRQRALLRFVRDRARTKDPSGGELRLYAMEQITPFYRVLEQLELGDTLGSEYLGADREGGEVRKGMRHEDAEALSFDDGSLDFVLSNDVLEHVHRPGQAVEQVYRVLRPAGEFIFSIPFHAEEMRSRRRARVVDGEVRHLVEPEFHDDPLSRDGSLVFVDFGWDFLDVVRDAGFVEVETVVYWSYEYGHLGGTQLFFHATKGESTRSGEAGDGREFP